MNENRTAYFVSTEDETNFGIREILVTALSGCSLDNDEDRQRVADVLTEHGLVFLDSVAGIPPSREDEDRRLRAHQHECYRIIETHNEYLETWTALAAEIPIPMDKIARFMPISYKFSAEAAAIVRLTRHMGVNAKYNAQTGEISLHD